MDLHNTMEQPERVVLVGTGEYMLENEFVPVEDNIDETFTGSMGSIMYMAIDGTLAAKFYIKYSVNSEFEKTLRAFYDAGVCVAVKTLDPCVTTELVSGFLKGSNYPFAVVNKGSEGTQMSAVSEKTDGTEGGQRGPGMMGGPGRGPGGYGRPGGFGGPMGGPPRH